MDFNSFSPTASFFIVSTKSFAIFKGTSASNNATLISRIAIFTSSSVNTPFPSKPSKVLRILSDKLLNILLYYN